MIAPATFWKYYNEINKWRLEEMLQFLYVQFFNILTNFAAVKHIKGFNDYDWGKEKEETKN